jgi:oxygen-independent coproporphyrinogen-3 oxidase
VYNEYVMTGLRTIWGVDIRKLNDRFKDHFVNGIREFEKQGFVTSKESDQIYVLTREGRHLADFIAMELFFG